jgi:hypothetical protein
MVASRRKNRAVLAATVAVSLAFPLGARADSVPVPISLQADLLYMIAAHDLNLPARSGGEVRTLVVTKSTDDSSLAAAQFKAAATAKSAVAGLPHVVRIAPFTTAPALAEACRSNRLSIVYLTPGFSGLEAAAIARALEGGSVLTVAAAPAMVKRGAVLGFTLVSGRARLLVNLAQAAKQRVAFGDDVLGLMAAPQ